MTPLEQVTEAKKLSETGTSPEDDEEPHADGNYSKMCKNKWCKCRS